MPFTRRSGKIISWPLDTFCSHDDSWKTTDVTRIQTPTNQKQTKGRQRLCQVRLAIPAHATHCCAKKRESYNRDCAYPNEFPLMAVGLDVIIPQARVTYGNICFSRETIILGGWTSEVKSQNASLVLKALKGRGKSVSFSILSFTVSEPRKVRECLSRREVLRAVCSAWF